jgi:hypothetical protein
MKKMKYQEKSFSGYSWRAFTGSEIDYIEEKAGKFVKFVKLESL